MVSLIVFDPVSFFVLFGGQICHFLNSRKAFYNKINVRSKKGDQNHVIYLRN